VKVFTYGNVLNNAYNVTRFLRARGIDAEMFLDDSAPTGQNYPWWEHRDLSPENLPSWIHYHRVTATDILLQREPFKQMARDFSACDIALVCHWGPILAQAAGVPTLFFSYGGDVAVAHTSRELREAARRVAHLNKPGIRDIMMGLRQRRALKEHVSRVGILMGYQIDNYVRPMGLVPKMVKLRLAWDIEAYEPNPQQALVDKYAEFDVVYFMLTRHSWTSVWNDIKGNDKFIRAFARLVREKRANVRLVCIEKGPDVAASKQLIRSLGIESAVEWVGEMTKDSMRAYYSLPNVVVADQFWHDDWQKRFPADTPVPRIGFGSGSIEALSAKRPLITVFFEHEFYEGAEPPILRAFREDEIFERLIESIEMGPDGRRELGERGHAFVMKYHDWRVTIDMYIRQLEEIHARKPLPPQVGSHI
jgi:glycosyltransferase involved in cell wall biosynthesis